MTIHKKYKKGFFKLLIIVLCLILIIFTIVAYLNKTGKTSKNTNNKNIDSKEPVINAEEQIEKDIKLTKIAFEKNNNVYLYDEVNEEIKSLGDNSKLKELLILSPDKSKIAFKYFNEGKAEYPPHVLVYDIQTENLIDIIINNKDTQQVIELEWVDNENILVAGHINPSDSGYAVYNVKNGAEVMSCVGTIRDVSINRNKMLYSNTPHVFPRPRDNLYINGNKIFESNKDEEEIFDAVISQDGKMLAFRSSVSNEVGLNGEVAAFLNLANINSDGKSLSDFKSISIGSDTAGEMKFDDKNNINIIGDEYMYVLKGEILIKEKNNSPKKAELSDSQLNKFKEVLAKQFPEDFIPEDAVLDDLGIYNVQAF